MNCQLLNFTLEVVIGVMVIAAVFVGFLLWRWRNEALTLAKQANPSADIGFISNT